MTEEDEILVLKDLSARLIYGVKGIITCDESNTIFTVTGINYNVLHFSFDVESCYVKDFKPYLRPLSDMSDEEEREMNKLLNEIYDFSFRMEEKLEMLIVQQSLPYMFIDYCNKHHFDYRGLISMGLAIAVTGDNNPYNV